MISSIFSVAVLFLGIPLPILDKFSVFFVRRFWTPFFEQVVLALVVRSVTSPSDIGPQVERRFRLFD
jgi:hypothetical protein